MMNHEFFPVVLFIYDAFHACGVLSVLTRSDQMFMRPPTPPDARARPSGLKASVLTGVMWPFSWKTHTAPSPDHWVDWRNFNTSRSLGTDKNQQKFRIQDF